LARIVNGLSSGVGVMDIYGGSVSAADLFRSSAAASMPSPWSTVANGGVAETGSGNNSVAFGWDANANSYGVLNILNGGLVNASAGSKNLDFSPSNAGNTGIVNLNAGGTAIVYARSPPPRAASGSSTSTAVS
jgi:hypothetical protein